MKFRIDDGRKMFGFKKKSVFVFGTLQQVILELVSAEWTAVVRKYADLENKRPPGLNPIPSKYPKLRELFVECVAFHIATLYFVALRLVDGDEADYVTGGTVQEVSFNVQKYIGREEDQIALQQRISSRGSQLTSFQQFHPDMPADALFENFESSTMGQHSLATIGFLDLSKYSPEATLVILAGRASVVSALETDLYGKVIKQSLPGIRLSRAFPGDLKR
jgi:hypothetical protein